MAITLIALNVFLSKNCIIVLMGLAVFFTASLALPKYRQAKVVPVSLGAALFACLLFCFNYYNTYLPQMSLDNKTINTSFYVVDEGEQFGEQYRYVAKTTEIRKDGAPQNIKIVLKTDEQIEPYKLTKGNLKYNSIKSDPFHSYGRFADDIYNFASCDNVFYKGKEVLSFNKYINGVRNSITNCMTKYVKGQEGAFSNAIITGDKHLLSFNTNKYFNNSGTSHIMAVSGLHLTFIIGLFSLLCRLIKLKKQISNLLSVALTLLYMSLAGFSGSITRAGIMMIIILLGEIINKRADTLNSLGVAVAIICLNPYAVTDIGALYSVLTVLSMILIMPRIRKMFYVHYDDPLFKKHNERFADLIVSSVSVSLTGVALSFFTLPVSYLFFNRISITGPIANIIVIPFGGACVVFSMITYFASLLGVNWLTIFVAGVTRILDKIVLAVVKYFSSFKASVITFDNRFGLVIAFALLIVAIGFLFYKIGIKRACTFATCFIVLTTVLINYYDGNLSKVYVTSSGSVVANYKDKTVVYGVDSYDDLYDIMNILDIIDDDIDVYIVTNSHFAPSLAKEESVNFLIANEFDDIILVNTNFNHLEVQNNYNLKLSDNFVLQYDNGDVNIDINGFTVSTNNSSANVFVTKDMAYDINGKIDLSKGNVVYTVYDENTYKVRRINQWQK